MRAIFAIFAIAILAIAGVQLFSSSLAASGDQIVVSNETFQPDAGDVTQLEQSNRPVFYNRSVAVADENGNRSIEGQDYRWIQDNGTVEALPGGNLEGDNSATITYGYRRSADGAEQAAVRLSTIPQTLGLLLPVGAVVFLLVALRGS